MDDLAVDLAGCSVVLTEGWEEEPPVDYVEEEDLVQESLEDQGSLVDEEDEQVAAVWAAVKEEVAAVAEEDLAECSEASSEA